MALYPPWSDGWAESRRRAFEESFERHREQDRLLLETRLAREAHLAATAEERERERIRLEAEHAARAATERQAFVDSLAEQARHDQMIAATREMERQGEAHLAAVAAQWERDRPTRDALARRQRLMDAIAKEEAQRANDRQAAEDAATARLLAERLAAEEPERRLRACLERRARRKTMRAPMETTE